MLVSIQLQTGFVLDNQRKWNEHKKFTWPMREFCVGDPTQPIFHLFALGVCVEGNASFGVRIGGKANFSVFRCQHVGIPNTKLLHWGYCPMRPPNASVFASLWNTDLKPLCTQCKSPCSQRESQRTQCEHQHELMEYSLQWGFRWPCWFHIVCVNFILLDTNAAFGGILALVFTQPDYQRL